MAAGRLGLAALLLLATAGTPTFADSLCAGTVSGSVLQALPRPTTVSLTQPISDDANPGLTKQFLTGLQSSGLTVAPPGQGNTQLDLTFTVIAAPGASSGTFKGFGWMSGTQAPSGTGSALPGTTVSVSIEATDLTTQTMAWVGTIQCKVRTADPNALAVDLGQVVARTLGRSVDQHAF